MEKPTLPKGTRDFGPAQMAKRQFILENIKKVFQKYGFQPLETPAMENLSTLTGKYGEEGDQLLFKITDSGNFLNKISVEAIQLFPGKRDDLSAFIDLLNSDLNNQNLEINQPSVKKLIFELSKNKPLIKVFLNRNADVIASIFLTWKGEVQNLQQADPIKHMGLASEKKNIVINWLSNLLKWDEVNYQIETGETKPFQNKISEKGLRYDLTVPFARFVVMNRNEITFPFKRYQIQPVWRADRPQKGRYREFYQCDADVVGTDSLICEAEIVLMIKEVFKRLGIEDYSIKVNHRGILSGLAELCDAKGNETSLFIAIDKLDKIGEEKVKEELRTRGFSENNLTTLFEILNFNGTIQQKIEFLTSKFSTTPTGQKGINDFKEVLRFLSDYGASEDHVEFDMTLARGLSYYTGCIFEVKINKVSIGSVSGGGRYDNLTGVFGLPGVSGVGFSFGVDRLYDAMEELKLFPQEAQISTQVLIAHFDAESKRYGLKVLQTLRENGIASEIYPDSVKIQKQLDFANKKMVPYVMVIGSEEVKSGMLSFKNMKTGEQFKLTIEDILKRLNVGNGQ